MAAKDTKAPLSGELEALGKSVLDATAWLRERQAEVEQVKARAAEMGHQVVEAHADGDAAKAAKLGAQRAQVEGDGLREAEERVAGAQLRLQRARAAQGTFARENADGLLGELTRGAVAAAAGVDRALRALVDAKAEWAREESRVVGVLRLAGRDVGAVARFPEEIDAVVRSVRRASGACVAPLPREAQVARIAPYDDPDPAVRGLARAKFETVA